jgi:hypothetical protein
MGMAWRIRHLVTGRLESVIVEIDWAVVYRINGLGCRQVRWFYYLLPETNQTTRQARKRNSSS